MKVKIYSTVTIVIKFAGTQTLHEAFITSKIDDDTYRAFVNMGCGQSSPMKIKKHQIQGN